MLALVDENLTLRLPRALRKAGHTAQHFNETEFAGQEDKYILANILHVDCLITNDAFRQRDDRISAFNALLDGLRIVWIEATRGARFGRNEQVEYVMRHLDEIVALVEDPDGPALIEIIENGSRLRLTARSELDDWFRRPR